MVLPRNFTGTPGESPHHFFRNVCLEFKKQIHATKDLAVLEREMQRFLGASKQMNWHHQNSSVYRKDTKEKAAEKVWSEFQRYTHMLRDNAPAAQPQDLLDALAEIESMIKNWEVS